eukprot:PITA_15231
MFENGPYFYDNVGLFMRYWEECYNPDKEKILAAPVWVRLFGLPMDICDLEILEGIGNTIGSFVKIAETTKKGRYTSYARICVYMNIANPIPDTVELEYHEEVWQRTLDYEHIPFRCHRCHEYGHLVKECPLTMEEEERKIKKQKKNKQIRKDFRSFEILQEEGEYEDQTMEYQEDKEKDISSSSERTHTKRKEPSDTPEKGKEQEEQTENMETEMEINRGEDLSI